MAREPLLAQKRGREAGLWRHIEHHTHGSRTPGNLKYSQQPKGNLKTAARGVWFASHVDNLV
jgi:hypothetical protein